MTLNFDCMQFNFAYETNKNTFESYFRYSHYFCNPVCHHEFKKKFKKLLNMPLKLSEIFCRYLRKLQS